MASGHISFEEVGPELSVGTHCRNPCGGNCYRGQSCQRGALTSWMYALVLSGRRLPEKSSIIWNPNLGGTFEVTIYNNDMLVYQNQVTYGKSFADVTDWTANPFISIPSTVLVLLSTRDPLPRPIM